MNSTDRLDLDSRQKRQIDISVTKTNSIAQTATVQIGTVRSSLASSPGPSLRVPSPLPTRREGPGDEASSSRTRIACMNVCVLYYSAASFIYTRDYVSQKNT